MNNSQTWYIIRAEDKTCEIITVNQEPPEATDSWGPFSSQAEAIAKRVGLIRSGKCKPQ
ncbi:MAG: hypothetical protein AB4368_09790 [Xenococcaceae cyanobacterium]